MRPHSVIRAEVGQDVTLEFIEIVPRSAGQTLSLQDAEPDFDLIQPRTMLGQEMPDDPARMRVHPLGGFGSHSGLGIVADQM